LTGIHKPFKELVKSRPAFAVGFFWVVIQSVLYHPLRVFPLFKAKFAMTQTWEASIGALLKSTNFEIHHKNLSSTLLITFVLFSKPISVVLTSHGTSQVSANEVKRYSEIQNFR